MTQTEALKQLREVHATQSRDGCWDIDDYMLGLYNGLELALSIAENRECRYKQRPKSQPEQEPVAWWNDTGTHIDLNVSGRGTPLYTHPLQRTWVGLTYEEKHEIRYSHMTSAEFIEFIEAKLKDKNTRGQE